MKPLRTLRKLGTCWEITVHRCPLSVRLIGKITALSVRYLLRGIRAEWVQKNQGDKAVSESQLMPWCNPNTKREVRINDDWPAKRTNKMLVILQHKKEKKLCSVADPHSVKLKLDGIKRIFTVFQQPIWTHFSSLNIFSSNLIKIYFNIIPPSTTRSSGRLPSVFRPSVCNVFRMIVSTYFLIHPLPCGLSNGKRICPLWGTKLCFIYRVIHKSVKHFKNLQQIDCATDHGSSYVDRERNCWSFF